MVTKRLAEDLCDKEMKPKLLMDNQGAKSIAKNCENSKRSRHIQIKYHRIKDLVERNLIELDYVQTGNNCADILTKSLSSKLLARHRERLCVTC